MKAAVRVAITGAAGNIGYAVAFRIAAGNMLGPDQPVILNLIEIPPVLPALGGVEMELRDCAFPLLEDVLVTADIDQGFEAVDYALLIGSKPRSKGMERSDLLTDNGKIFGPQGRALNDRAARDVRVLVVGNPANTNCLIAARNAPDLEARQFTCMTRLDHNRAISLLAEKTGAAVTGIRRATIWGNHSLTQFPDLYHCRVDGRPALDRVDPVWYRDHFIPRVQKRGAEIIQARGASSAASASSAAIDHMRDWILGSAQDDWVSMGVPSSGDYGIAEGILFSYPVTCGGGDYQVVPGLELGAHARQMLERTEQELLEEREAVKDLLPA